MVSKQIGFLFMASTAVLAAGCATAPSNLKPGDVSAGNGGIMGQITVLVNGTDTTGKCYAEFTDADQHRKAYLNLDQSGWVFSSLSSGDTYLSMVLCSRGNHNVHWEGRGLKFSVGDSGQLAYFGHMTFRIEDKGMNGALLLLGGLGAGIAANTATGATDFEITNEMDDAKGEFQKRFGSAGAAMTTLSAVPDRQAGTRVPSSAP